MRPEELRRLTQTRIKESSLQNIGVQAPTGYWHGENLRIMDMDVLQIHFVRWQPEIAANSPSMPKKPLIPDQHVGI